jgi:hypothetical protein
VPISELQSATVEYVGKRHPKTVTETVINMAETVKEAAIDAKETIMGPLANAGKNLTGSNSTSGEAGETKKGKKQK